jgi:hypothetical protein
MCYTRKDWSREEEARWLRAEEGTQSAPREADTRSRRHGHEHEEERQEEKPLTEKIKEVVGVR